MFGWNLSIGCTNPYSRLASNCPACKERALPRFGVGHFTIGIGPPHFLYSFGLARPIGRWRTLSPSERQVSSIAGTLHFFLAEGLMDGFLPVFTSLPRISGFDADFDRANAFPLSFPQPDACGESESNLSPVIHSFFCQAGFRACLSTQTLGIIQTRAVSRALFHVEQFRGQSGVQDLRDRAIASRGIEE